MEEMLEQVDNAKYNHYEEEMEEVLEQPYFARVNTKTEVMRGELVFLPCRVKELAEGYTVRRVRLALSVPLQIKNLQELKFNNFAGGELMILFSIMLFTAYYM